MEFKRWTILQICFLLNTNQTDNNKILLRLAHINRNHELIFSQKFHTWSQLMMKTKAYPKSFHRFKCLTTALCPWTTQISIVHPAEIKSNHTSKQVPKKLNMKLRLNLLSKRFKLLKTFLRKTLLRIASKLIFKKLAKSQLLRL